MKRIFRGLTFVALVAVVVFAIILTFRDKPSESEKMAKLVDDISLERMQQDVEAQVAVHKKYIDKLQSLYSRIRAIGDRIENKVNVAKGFGEIGDAYIKERFLPLSLANYNLGLQVFPQDPTLNYKKGLVLANMAVYGSSKQRQLFVEAKSLYEKALKLDPRYTDPHYALALLYLVSSEKGVADIGTLQQALSEIDLYLQQVSNSIGGHFLKARIAVALQDNQLAVQSYQTILNMSSVGSAAYNQAKDNITQLGFR